MEELNPGLVQEKFPEVSDIAGEEIDRAPAAKKVLELKRFDVHQIIQHIIMMGSFTVLVFTGMPMKFNTWGISEWWVATLGGINNVRNIHHFAAFVMCGVCIYHLLYIGWSMIFRRKPFPKAMLPSVKDFVNLYQEMLFFIGKRKERPRFDRFNWREKFDYWAIFWGIPVMAGSGFILLFPAAASKVMPGWVIPVALIAHSHESLLALGWIALIHIFFNHFSPGLFPLNKAIFTGKISEERYRKEHPVEYARIKGLKEPGRSPLSSLSPKPDA